MVDGFPRSMIQAEFMEQEMKKYDRDFVIIHFELSKEKALERMVKRAEIEGRVDDNAEAMATRIDAFMNETLPAIKHFEALGKVITVNADASIEEVQTELKSMLKI